MWATRCTAPGNSVICLWPTTRSNRTCSWKPCESRSQHYYRGFRSRPGRDEYDAGAGKSITGKPVTDFGDPLQIGMADCLQTPPIIWMRIAEHLYPQAEQAFDAVQGKFVPVNDSMADKARRMPNRVKCVTDAWDEYQKRFPQIDMSKLPISLDEWTAGMLARPGLSWTAGDVFQALSAAEGLNEMFRHSGLFAASAYTALSRLLAYDKTDVTVAPLGLMFEMYRQHYGTIPVRFDGQLPATRRAGHGRRRQT